MPDTTPPTRLKIQLFGTFSASQNGSPIQGLHLREGERLLAYLVLKLGEPVTRRELAKWFWPAEVQMGIIGQEDFLSVRQALHSLRRALGEDALRLTRQQRGTVAFDLTDVGVDVMSFDQATRKDGSEALLDWKAAAEIYHAPLLEGWNDVWVVDARARRKRAYEYTLRRLAEHSLSQGDAAAAEVWMRKLLVSRPDEETTARDLIRVLTAGGRYAEANEVLAVLKEAVKAAGRALDAGTETLALPPPPSLNFRPAPETAMKQPAGADSESSHSFEPQPEFATLPQAEPAGGAVPTDSSFYVVRETDAEFHAALARRDSIVLLKGARQVGKTSLLARGLQKGRESGGMRVVATDFQQFNEAQFATPDTLFLALATSIAFQLDLDISPRRTWDSDYSPNMNFEQFLRRHVLRAFPEPLLWGMDEVDRLFAYPYRSEVFGLFRSWHNARSLDPAGPWSRLTLAIAYATEAHLFITDLNQSPFNVGTRLTLEDFTQEHVAALNILYNRPLLDTDIARFYALVGGQPYLVRRGLDEIARRGLRLEAMEADAKRSGGIFEDHLRRLAVALSRSPELLHAVREISVNRPCPSPETFYRLRTAGILSGASSQEAGFRCQLYADYFAVNLP